MSQPRSQNTAAPPTGTDPARHRPRQGRPPQTLSFRLAKRMSGPAASMVGLGDSGLHRGRPRIRPRERANVECKSVVLPKTPSGKIKRFELRPRRRVAVVITGVHAIVFTKDPDQIRAFFRDVLDFPSVDAGNGWLIFALPPAELAAHPTDEHAHHKLYLMCDDIRATVAELEAKGV